MCEKAFPSPSTVPVRHLRLWGLGVAVLSADVFYQVKLSASSFLPSLGHLPIYYYLICTICPFWGQHQVLVDLSLHLKSINCRWELMDGNGLSLRNVPKRLSSGLWASSRSQEELRRKWNVMEIHEWGKMKTKLFALLWSFAWACVAPFESLLSSLNNKLTRPK